MTAGISASKRTHVDVALVELAEAPALRTFAAVHALHLVAAERKGEIVLVLGDVTRQRHGEIEAECQLRHGALRQAFPRPFGGLVQRAGRLHEVHLPLRFAA
jgi:hypothetical protein